MSADVDTMITRPRCDTVRCFRNTAQNSKKCFIREKHIFWSTSKTLQERTNAPFLNKRILAIWAELDNNPFDDNAVKNHDAVDSFVVYMYDISNEDHEYLDKNNSRDDN